jgi:hypothetical protein
VFATALLPPLLASFVTLPSTGLAQSPPEASPVATSADETFDEAQSVRKQANTAGVASQERIDSISDATETLFARYSNALKQIDSTRIYNRQMRDLIAAQEAELASLQEQLDRVAVVGRSVMPLMLRMIVALEKLVELDLPFLLEERTERAVELRLMMNRADVTSSEKYRRIMEAYQIENEYGRTIEAYRGTLVQDDKENTVDFLRFGRIALLYQTLDGTRAGVWDRKAGAWTPLDASHRIAIRDGLRIARNQAAPDLIRIPLPAVSEDDS